MNETTDYKKLATAYMVNTYSRMCSLQESFIPLKSHHFVLWMSCASGILQKTTSILYKMRMQVMFITN